MRKGLRYFLLSALLLAVFINILAWNSSTFCDFYVSNIFPVWFGDYDYRTIDVDSLPEKWKSIFRKYSDMYEVSPLDLRYYSIEEDLINLAVLYDAGSFLRITYKCDVKKNNWLYLNSCIHVSLTEEETPVDLSKVAGPTIDDFDYLYLNEIE